MDAEPHTLLTPESMTRTWQIVPGELPAMASSPMLYVQPSALFALKSYKYSGEDRSLVAKYIMQPYWSRLVLLFPTWVAPNLITLLGLCCVAINVAILAWFAPDLEQDCPPWVYFSFAIGLFAYTSLDAIDGKQARRTGTSSPLGELFDHGCDAINTTFGSLITAQVVHLDQSWRAVAILFLALSYFYCTTWETYHTGTLFLGYVNGPVEGTLFLCFVYSLTGVFGRSIWLRPLASLLGQQWFTGFLEPLGHIPINDAATCGFLLMSGLSIATSLASVRRACAQNKKSYTEALMGILPLIVMLASASLWLLYSPSDIMHHRLFLFELALGLDFAMFVARIILAHLVHTSFPTLQPSLVISACIALLLTTQNVLKQSWIDEEAELTMFLGYLILTSVSYVHMCSSVINQLCDFLDIYCLVIKRKHDSSKQS